MLLYKIRRMCQRIAHRIMPDEEMSKFYYWVVLKKHLNLKNPKTFNEKIQWMKLYYYPKNLLIIRTTDKYTVRKYIESKGMKNNLVPLLGVWDKVAEIEWDKLPQKFVLKCNHGCAYNILVNDKEKADEKSIKIKLDAWLKEDFGAFNIEPHYSKIKHHRIICEKFLGEHITDYKFFCFNGQPKYMYVSNDLIHDRQAKIGFFYLDGRKIPLHRDDYSDIEEVEFPSFYYEMLNSAKILCQEFLFVRVDFFVTHQKYYFAELTFTPSAGMMPFNPEEYDMEWGKELKIDCLLNGAFCNEKN